MLPQILVLTLLCIGVVSCNTAREEGSVSFTRFRGIPPAIEGCSCSFTSSEKAFRDGHYLFVSDLDSLAYIGINNKIVALRLIASTREQNVLDERDYTETYSNGVYTLILSVRFGGNTGDEVWWNTGMMKLFFKDTKVAETSFLGECGC